MYHIKLTIGINQFCSLQSKASTNFCSVQSDYTLQLRAGHSTNISHTHLVAAVHRNPSPEVTFISNRV